LNENRYVLDTYAVLAVIEDEPGAQTVAEIITAQNIMIYLSIVSLGEIYYIILRRLGEQAAEEVVQNTLDEPSLAVVDATWPRVKDAARIKATGGLSYADSFVLALGKELRAPVVTGDPEIKATGKKVGVEVIWIGPAESDL